MDTLRGTCRCSHSVLRCHSSGRSTRDDRLLATSAYVWGQVLYRSHSTSDTRCDSQGECLSRGEEGIDSRVVQRGTKKVETARKRGGIKIVRLEWFNDCIALWKRQDEELYLFYEASLAGASNSPPVSDHQISSDPEPDADDWDLEPVAGEDVEMGEGSSGAVGALHLEEIDWNDINDEVEAAMMESDDESADERMKSDDELTDESSVGGARYGIPQLWKE